MQKERRSMTIETILSRLDKVKKTHSGYKACCPVHKDKNPSMVITEKNGKVLCHCFSCGARGSDVVESLGLSASELFSTEYQGDRDAKYHLKKFKLEDEMVVSIYEQDKKQGKYLTHSDFKRYKLAKARLESIAA